MILSGHQPCYLPGLGLFSKVMHSHAFMHVPHCQYVAGSWHSHNFIRGGRLTVPVRATLGNSILEAQIDYTKTWQRKHLHAMEINYSKAPYFQEFFPDISWFLGRFYPNLAAMNMQFTDYMLDMLGCGRFDKSIYHGDNLDNSDAIAMLISMCKAVNCDTYLSNLGSMSYIGAKETARMAEAGITHKWFSFRDPDYGQGTIETDYQKKHPSGYSILNILFYKGLEQSAKIIRGAGHVMG